MTRNNIPENTPISRGVNLTIGVGRKVVAFVFVSKNRTKELELLKSSPFYQRMELITSRADRNLFKMELENAEAALDFIKQAVEAANAVGVQHIEKAKLVAAKTKTKTVA